MSWRNSLADSFNYAIGWRTNPWVRPEIVLNLGAERPPGGWPEAGNAWRTVSGLPELVTHKRRYRRRPHFRAVNGDQLGHRGDRRDQANPDHDGDSDPCAQLHSSTSVSVR